MLEQPILKQLILAAYYRHKSGLEGCYLSKQEKEEEGLYEHKDNVGEKASTSLSLSLLSPLPRSFLKQKAILYKATL